MRPPPEVVLKDLEHILEELVRWILAGNLHLVRRSAQPIYEVDAFPKFLRDVHLDGKAGLVRREDPALPCLADRL